jgi:hypothetical protein
VYVLEAAGKTYIIHTVAFTVAYTWTQILPWAATAVAIALTIVIARHYSRSGTEPDTAHANSAPTDDHQPSDNGP